jgi:copper chaperone CopZ
MRSLKTPAPALLGATLLVFAVAACGSTVATSSFTGEKHEVAQAISNLQSDTRAAEQQKVCENDLAGPVLARLSAAPGGCKQAIKGQLAEIDNFDVTVESVQITAAKRTATARVKSVYDGKKRVRTVSLVFEGGKWKILGVA